MQPLISIVVPCYNQAEYLDDALLSVLSQRYSHWECIIVNDGSQDNTHEIAKKWLEKDARFKYISKQNEGLSAARNDGIESANGIYILPLDADDKISPYYLELAVEAFAKDDALKVVYCKAEKFGAETGAWRLQPFSLYNLARENVIFCSAVYKKKDWQLAKGYDKVMIYGFEDWEFWISMLKNGGTVKKLDHIGFYYRIKPASMLRELKFEKKAIMMDYISIKHADFFVLHLGNFVTLSNRIDEHHEALQSKRNILKLFIKKIVLFWRQ